MQPDAHQGENAQEPPEEVEMSYSEVVHLGAEHWFAREFVGSLISVATAMEIPTQDYLADKVYQLSHRLALAESEVQVLRQQVAALQEKVGEGTDPSVNLSSTEVSLPNDLSTAHTNNGADPA
jgi:uncharacterized protein (DUF342 family)